VRSVTGIVSLLALAISLCTLAYNKGRRDERGLCEARLFHDELQRELFK